MANVTQTIQNYLSGVARIPDFNKLPGQVRDLLNGYPDTTFGLVKRPGTEFLWSDFPETRLISEILIKCSSISLIGKVIHRSLFVLILKHLLETATENVIFIYNLETGDRVPVEAVNNPVNPNQPYIYLRKDDTDSGGNAGARTGWGPERFSLASDDKRTVVVNRTQRPFVQKRK